MTSSPISTIIFDCDGVLVDSEVLAQDIELDVLRGIGLHYDRREFSVRFTGTSTAAFLEALEADGWARLGRSIADEVRRPMRERMRAVFRERLAEVPGARAALETIRHRRAVASSSTARALRSKLEHVGHWTYFAPHVYSADQVAHPKPAPDLFLHAAARLAVSPADCLVIEDSVNGVRAARGAKMRVWGFTGGGHQDAGSAERLTAAGAERIVPNWAEAARLFESL